MNKYKSSSNYANVLTQHESDHCQHNPSGIPSILESKHLSLPKTWILAEETVQCQTQHTV